MGVGSQNKMLDLLGQAYQAVDDYEKIDELMDDINSYLFEDEGDAVVSKNLPEFAGFDPHLETHIGQLEKLMAKQANDDKIGLSMGSHAQMIFSNQGRVLTANSHTNRLFDGKSDGYLDDLPLSLDSVKTLKDLIREVSAGVQNLERIIYLQIEADGLQTAFGYCRSIPIGDDKMGLHVTLSIFEWSVAIFRSLENALGLSESEGLVLQGVLKGQTRLEIAQERGRSISTIKAQANAVLHKANCSNMNELANLCTSIAYVVGLSDKLVKNTKLSGIVDTPRQALRILPLADERKLAYYEYGDPNGTPVIYFHGFYQGPYFTDDMIRKFLNNGLRIIAPSRPYFGYTDPPKNEKDFVKTVNDDVVALVKHLKLGQNIIVAAHHAGGSFAFRFAKHFEQKITGMVMIGAGIPIEDVHIKYMSKNARMAAVASRHAPSLMRLLITLAVKNYKRNGLDAMLDKSYSESGVGGEDDLVLKNKFERPVLKQGMQHLVQQGAEAFVHDGRAQMLDWTAEFDAVNCRQTWVMGRHCPVMGAHFVSDYIGSKTNHSVEIIEDSGYNILFQSFDKFIEKLLEMRQADTVSIDVA